MKKCAKEVETKNWYFLVQNFGVCMFIFCRPQIISLSTYVVHVYAPTPTLIDMTKDVFGTYDTKRTQDTSNFLEFVENGQQHCFTPYNLIYGEDQKPLVRVFTRNHDP